MVNQTVEQPKPQPQAGQTQTQKQKQKPLVTRESMVGEVIERWPGTAEILADYGLHCVGCSFNPFDNIENGCRLHGLEEEKIDQLVAEANAHANVNKDAWDGHPAIELTPKALAKIKELAAAEGKGDHGLRVSAALTDAGGPEYGLELEPAPKENDTVLEQDGFKIFFVPQIERLVRNTVVDHVKMENDEGFKVEKRTEKKGCCSE